MLLGYGLGSYLCRRLEGQVEDANQQAWPPLLSYSISITRGKGTEQEEYHQILTVMVANTSYTRKLSTIPGSDRDYQQYQSCKKNIYKMW